MNNVENARSSGCEEDRIEFLAFMIRALPSMTLEEREDLFQRFLDARITPDEWLRITDFCKEMYAQRTRKTEDLVH